MNLYLLRHGRAQDRAPSDALRALTADGRLQVSNVAAQFQARGLRPQRCLVSPYLRARQTAEGFLSAARLALSQEDCALLCPDSSTLELLRFLQAQPEADILLIGHNPLLSNLCALLREGEPRATLGLGTGDLVGLRMEAVVPGCAELLFHLIPAVTGARDQ